MPKVQNLINATRPSVNKPARGAESRCAEAADFRSTLEDARKKAEPAEPRKPEQAPNPKRRTNSAEVNPDSEPQDIARDTAAASDVVEAADVEADEAERASEPPESDVAEAETEENPASAADLMAAHAVAVPGPAPAAGEDAAADVEDAEESDVSIPARQGQPAAAKNMVAPLKVAEPLSDAVAAVADMGLSAEELPIEAMESSAAATKHSKPPAPAAGPAADTEPKPAAEPNRAPSLEPLEQNIAAFGDQKPAETTPATGASDSTATVSTLTAPPPGAQRPAATHAQPSAPIPQPPMSAQSFADANHAKIVTSVRAELLPTGGTMQIRLDPPELGALQVLVHMRDGAMTASFQTTSDDATKLLSHSLGQLKQVLESQGVSVDKLHVQQVPRDQQPSNSSDDHRQQQQGGQGGRDDETARHEQQRKEMIRRMWRRLSGNQDPLDLVA